MINLLKRILGIDERAVNKIYEKAKYQNLARVLQQGGEAALLTYAKRVLHELIISRSIRTSIYTLPEDQAIAESGDEVVEPMGAPASSSMPPASRGPSLEEAIRLQRSNPEPPIYFQMSPRASAAAAASPTAGMTPRTREVFTKLLPLIQESANRALNFTREEIIPILRAHADRIISPASGIIKAETARSINYLREHPEMIVGVLYAMAFSFNNSQMRYIADHEDIHNSLLQEILNYVKVISTGAFGGRLTRSAYNIVLSLSKYYKPYIKDAYRHMGDDPAAAEQRFQRQFPQQNPWGDSTAHLTGDPLQISQQELLDRLNVQYPGGAAAAAAPDPEDEVIQFIGIIAPYIEHIQVISSNILHSLLRPVEGQYTNIYNFDGYENLYISSTACKYLHNHTSTFIGILYAALFRGQMDIIDTTYEEHGLNYPSIVQATRAYFDFLKSEIPKTLKNCNNELLFKIFNKI